jgi:hypothetical protein
VTRRETITCALAALLILASVVVVVMVKSADRASVAGSDSRPVSATALPILPDPHGRGCHALYAAIRPPTLCVRPASRSRSTGR